MFRLHEKDINLGPVDWTGRVLKTGVVHTRSTVRHVWLSGKATLPWAFRWVFFPMDKLVTVEAGYFAQGRFTYEYAPVVLPKDSKFALDLSVSPERLGWRTNTGPDGRRLHALLTDAELKDAGDVLLRVLEEVEVE